ncbi:DinB family protein [bacterium]|nr:DinB family protein [bacterium]
MDTSTLLLSLGTSNVVINRNLEGINHRDSLVHPQPEGQTFNWILGHMVKTRNEILELIGKKSLYPKSKFDVYTPKDFSESKALDLDELKSCFNALQSELEDGIKSLSREKLNEPATLRPDRSDTVGSVLATILWHEAYHAGQLGTMRRVIGKDGKIKSPKGE